MLSLYIKEILRQQNLKSITQELILYTNAYFIQPVTTTGMARTDIKQIEELGLIVQQWAHDAL